jgi:hypothetical protein
MTNKSNKKSDKSTEPDSPLQQSEHQCDPHMRPRMNSKSACPQFDSTLQHQENLGQFKPLWQQSHIFNKEIMAK